MGRNHRKTVPTFLNCSECGNKQSIRRIIGRQREEGHTKHLWCIRCRETTAHIETKYEVRRMGETHENSV